MLILISDCVSRLCQSILRPANSLKPLKVLALSLIPLKYLSLFVSTKYASFVSQFVSFSFILVFSIIFLWLDVYTSLLISMLCVVYKIYCFYSIDYIYYKQQITYYEQKKYHYIKVNSRKIE